HQLTAMPPVHGDDVIEAVEVLVHHLTRDRVDVETMLAPDSPCARVGLIPFVKAVRSRRIDDETGLQPGLVGERPEDRLSERRPAYVPGAHEENPAGILGWGGHGIAY